MHRGNILFVCCVTVREVIFGSAKKIVDLESIDATTKKKLKRNLSIRYLHVES